MRVWHSIVLLLLLSLAACSSDQASDGASAPASAANGKSIIVYKSPT